MPPTIQKIIEEFEKECKKGYGKWSTAATYIELKPFLSSAFIKQTQLTAEKIKELYGEPYCGRLHHKKAYYHANDEECPAVKELNQLLTSYKESGLIK